MSRSARALALSGAAVVGVLVGGTAYAASTQRSPDEMHVGCVGHACARERPISWSTADYTVTTTPNATPAPAPPPHPTRPAETTRPPAPAEPTDPLAPVVAASGRSGA